MLLLLEFLEVSLVTPVFLCLLVTLELFFIVFQSSSRRRLPSVHSFFMRQFSPTPPCLFGEFSEGLIAERWILSDILAEEHISRFRLGWSIRIWLGVPSIPPSRTRHLQRGRCRRFEMLFESRFHLGRWREVPSPVLSMKRA